MSISFIEIIKIILLGVVEGVTEWLPISSTGHMLLVDEFVKLNMSNAFKEMFFIVIQLGAILAVVLIFWRRMLPFERSTLGQMIVKKDVISLWCKVVVACIPGALVTIAFDDYIEAHFHTPIVIAGTLIFYGIAFIVVESFHQKSPVGRGDLLALSYRTAFFIGMFQVLSIIPGTSRSGATIIGALLLGVSRVVAAEFTFFLAVPVMFGLSALKILKFGLHFSATEMFVLVLGMVVAFFVSVVVIKFLMSYIQKHDFKIFGWYRIALGILVLVWFL